MNENRAGSRIASPGPHGPYLPHAEIRQWFTSAAVETQLLSDADFDELARQFQVELNHANNAEIKRRQNEVSLDGLKDVSTSEWEERILGSLAAATEPLIEAASVLEKWSENYTWPSGLTLETLISSLREVRSSSSWRPSEAVRGRPQEAWHKPGRTFAEAVATALEKAGYKGSLKITYAESAPIKIATDGINWAYRSNLDTLGFVTSMRSRIRKKSVR